MKSAILLCLPLMICINCFSQKRKVGPILTPGPPFRPETTTFIEFISPNWQMDTASFIEKLLVSGDSVFYYRKKEKNLDSTLILIQYFDKAGNLIERDDYSLEKKACWQITNYSYVDDMLYKKEVISQNTDIKFPGTLNKEILTFEYDSAGNIVTKKRYLNSGDSLAQTSLTIWSREYDSFGHLTKEFETLPQGLPYLHHEYLYNSSGKLIEVKSYGLEKEWMYSYVHEYDKKKNSESVFLVNSSERILINEFYYDDKNRLIHLNSYPEDITLLTHGKQEFFYNSTGLIGSQTYQDINEKNYYFKHFYVFNSK